MRRLHEGGGAVPPTAVSVSVTRRAEAPAFPSALQVIVAVLDRTLGSDARTERALRLLRPILFAGVVGVIGVAFIVVAIGTSNTWWNLISGLGLAVASAGTVIMRRAMVRRQRRSDPSQASVVALTAGEAVARRVGGGRRKPPPREKSQGARSGAGANDSDSRRAVGKGCGIVPPSRRSSTPR
jgi:hypothetical protein